MDQFIIYYFLWEKIESPTTKIMYPNIKWACIPIKTGSTKVSVFYKVKLNSARDLEYINTFTPITYKEEEDAVNFAIDIVKSVMDKANQLELQHGINMKISYLEDAVEVYAQNFIDFSRPIEKQYLHRVAMSHIISIITLKLFSEGYTLNNTFIDPAPAIV